MRLNPEIFIPNCLLSLATYTFAPGKMTDPRLTEQAIKIPIALSGTAKDHSQNSLFAPIVRQALIDYNLVNMLGFTFSPGAFLATANGAAKNQLIHEVIVSGIAPLVIAAFNYVASKIERMVVRIVLVRAQEPVDIDTKKRAPEQKATDEVYVHRALLASDIHSAASALAPVFELRHQPLCEPVE